ncbi:hypothetical protein HOD61_01260 [archaeon]|jgi:hypothetical protein|nr:hypothetical protein [archaeon]
MGDSIVSLREELKKKDLTGSQKQDIRARLVNLIRKETIVKLSNNEPLEYHITYDTFQQSLEPVYFWTLDFMRNTVPSGLGLEVNKVEEEFEASVGGGYYGEMGQRASLMQEKAMQILGHVNTVIRSVLNLIYNLREFDMRLEIYDEADPKKQKDFKQRQAAEYSLKSVWMDQVDIKTGGGSINNLARGDLQFVTLRDAFFQVGDVKTVDKLDLNRRVKILLKKKIIEYSKWREISEQELRKRHSIEKTYLRSQIDSLRLYTKWAKPYFRAAQKLGMKEFKTDSGLPSPDMVSAFSNMQMELTLMGKREIKPSKVHPSYAGFKFKDKYFSVLEINFKYRTLPQSVRTEQGNQYVNSGVVDIKFNGYAMTDQDINDIEAHETFQDMELVESLTEFSLKELQDDIEDYLEIKKEDEPEKKKEKNILMSLAGGFSDIGKSLGAGFLSNGERDPGKFRIKLVKKAAQSAALDTCVLTYDVFKKAHRMTTW